MNLISTPLVLVGAVLAGAALCLSAVLVGRRRGRLPRTRALLALLLTSVLVLGTVALSGNARMGWFKTTGDLWRAVTGASSLDDLGTVTVLPPPGGTPERSAVEDVHAKLPASLAGHPGDPTWQADFTRDEHQDAWRAQVAGPASGLERSVTVWTPPGYSPTSGTTYDVVVFLHGFPGSDSGVVHSLDVAGTVPELMAMQRIRPTIFVVPDLNVNGDPPDCVDVRGRPAVETFVTRDLVQSVRTNFPNVSEQRAGWVIAGVSAGAYCAPVLYMRHQDQFWGALAMSGFDTPELGAVSRASEEVRRELEISSLVADHRRGPARMWLSATVNDTDSMSLLSDVTRAAAAGDEIATHVDLTGGHSWVTWSRQFPMALSWWARSVASGGHLPSGVDSAADPLPVPSPVTVPVPQSGHGAGAGEPAPSWVATAFALDGWGTLVTCLLALVAAVAGVIGLGPRLSWSGRARVPGFLLRLVGVFVVTVLACLGVLVVVNGPGGFFSSWSDLFNNWSMFV